MIKKAKKIIQIQENVENKVLHTGKVKTPKVDVWALDYGVKYVSDPNEDATDESKALEHEAPAKGATLPKNNEQPLINPNPSNLQPKKKSAGTKKHRHK